MNVVLFDTNRVNLFPLSYTRPISEFRVGIFTIKEKWKVYYANVSVKTEEYLSEKFPCITKRTNLWINSSILPNDNLITEINSLRRKNGSLIASSADALSLIDIVFIPDTSFSLIALSRRLTTSTFTSSLLFLFLIVRIIPGRSSMNEGIFIDGFFNKMILSFKIFTFEK